MNFFTQHVLITEILKDIGFDNKSKKIQKLKHNIYVYPRDYFYPYSTTGPSFAGCINYNNFKVCSCKAIPQGHYRIIEWHAGISPENTYTACPAGKTTLTPYAGQYAGGVSIDDCKYGSETQLCDSVDCVNLSDLGAPESWTDL